MSEEEQKKIFSNNLKYYLSLNNKTQKEVADAIGVSPQTFNTWMQGIALPRMGKVQKLADYFKIGKSCLIDDKKKYDNLKTDYNINIDGIDILFETISNYNSDSMERLLLYAKKLKELQDMEEENKGENQ